MENPTPLWKTLMIPIILLVVFILAIFGVLKLQESFKKPLKLEVSLPDSTTTTEEKINVTGSITKGALLKINDETITTDTEGNFSYQSYLSPGENKISFITESANSEPVTVVKYVTRNGPSLITDIGTPAKAAKRTDSLSSSGPKETIGFIGLTGIIFSLYIFGISRKKKSKSLSDYKLFTQKLN